MEIGKKYKTEINGFWFFGIYTDDYENAAILTGKKMNLIVPKHECVGVDEPTSNKQQCNIPRVGSHRELLTDFAVFMVKNMKHGDTPAWLVDQYFQKGGQ